VRELELVHLFELGPSAFEIVEELSHLANEFQDADLVLSFLVSGLRFLVVRAKSKEEEEDA